MPELSNPKWELFARLTALGKNRGEAYMGAGYKPKDMKAASQGGSTVYGRLEVKARVVEIDTELSEKAAKENDVDRGWVLGKLKANVETGMAAVPVLDREGLPTGEYKQELGAANRALELTGKELGMFADRIVFDHLDDELAAKTPEELRTYVRAAASDVGLRVVDMNDDETRNWIIRNAPRVGLCVVGDAEGGAAEGGEDPDGAAVSEDRAVQPVSETEGVPRPGVH